MSASLVGSEMCIRDRRYRHARGPRSHVQCVLLVPSSRHFQGNVQAGYRHCLLYTSDAADDM
eukprot:193818-Alexandrium_andersonii.AAC.1